VYGVALATSDAAFTCTAKVVELDVNPDAGVTDSQLPLLAALAVKLAVPPLAVTVNCPGDTILPLPVWYPKASDGGLTEKDGSVITSRVTCTTTAVPPVGVIVMLPLWLPGVRFPWFTETDKMACVVAEAVLTNSQLPVLTVATVNGTLADPAALDTVNDCAAGAAPPDTAVKFSVVLLTVTLPPVGGGLPPPALLIVRVTGTFSVAPFEASAMAPL